MTRFKWLLDSNSYFIEIWYCLLSLDNVKVGITDGENAPPNDLVSGCGLTPQDEQFKDQHHGWRHIRLGWKHCVDTLVKLGTQKLNMHLYLVCNHYYLAKHVGIVNQTGTIFCAYIIIIPPTFISMS